MLKRMGLQGLVRDAHGLRELALTAVLQICAVALTSSLPNLYRHTFGPSFFIPSDCFPAGLGHARHQPFNNTRTQSDAGPSVLGLAHFAAEQLASRTILSEAGAQCVFSARNQSCGCARRLTHER